MAAVLFLAINRDTVPLIEDSAYWMTLIRELPLHRGLDWQHLTSATDLSLHSFPTKQWSTDVLQQAAAIPTRIE